MISKKLSILWHYLICRHRPAFKNRAQLTRWQNRQFQRYKRRVLRHSPFYRSLTSRPLSHFPIMDKTSHMTHLAQLNTASIDPDEALSLAIKAEQERNFSPTLNGLTVGLSSGTSGGRGLFVVSPKEQAMWSAQVLAKLLPKPIWHKQKIAFFLRANSNLYESVGSRRIQFQYFDLLDDFTDHIQGLNQWQPDVLVAPASTLLRLAKAMPDHLQIKPMKVISVAEVLSPEDAAVIGKAFKQTVHQVYQATEGFLAHTCEHGNLHLNEDLLMVEKDWVDRDSGRYCPIITDLKRQSQPIIRYRLDDVLVDAAEPCPCGSVMGRIEFIEGRCDDVLHLKNALGTDQWLYPDFIRNAIISHCPEITAYQVDQTSETALYVALEPHNPSTTNAVSAAILALCARLDLVPPQLSFGTYVAPQAGQKLRRVRRLFQNPKHPTEEPS